jgi:hypothetical protein
MGIRFVATLLLNSNRKKKRKKERNSRKLSERELLYTCRLGETGRADEESESEKKAKFLRALFFSLLLLFVEFTLCALIT